MNSLIFDIQRFCVYDGPGIRTTVFFKGCNMRCKWCHNPESFSAKAQVLFHRNQCVNCGMCISCPQGAHEIGMDGHVFHRDRCMVCGKCTELCPKGALEVSGKSMTAEEVMKVIDKDAKYYKSSGGGVTFSGGEASLHADLLENLLQRCKEKGYHTALETNGQIKRAHLEKLIPLVDLFLLDVKHTDEKAHVEWTGAHLAPVLDTLSLLNERRAKTILRCVIVPGVNDFPKHFDALKKLKKNHPCVMDAEVMAYHDIGKGKWEALGMEYSLAHLKTASPDDKQHWEAMLQDE